MLSVHTRDRESRIKTNEMMNHSVKREQHYKGGLETNHNNYWTSNPKFVSPQILVFGQGCCTLINILLHGIRET